MPSERSAYLMLVLLAGAALLLWGACAGSRAENLTPLSGRQLYEGRCGACHTLLDPAGHSAREWRFAVKKYGRQARLRLAEQEAVLEYLLSRSKGE